MLRLENKNKIIILKLGGSLLTDKNRPLSIREDVLEKAVQQIINSKERPILIHGGGSFGHPVAKKYNISKGLNSSINNQILGVAETHDAMNKLNTIIIKKFLEKDFPAISIQPSSIFLKNSFLSLQSIEIIEKQLDLGILPVLYGDILFDKVGSFSIISGDNIALELCANLKKYKVSKVIFAIEKEGVYVNSEVKNTKEIKLATELSSYELDSLDLANLEEKIDVTGGIRGKINIIKEISKLNVPVQIINGLAENYILKALKNEYIVCTNINPNKTDSIVKEISDRKLDHLKIPIQFDVQHKKNYFRYIELIHYALPEIDINEIDLSLRFFNKNVSAPICISAITGGHPVSKEFNKILASAAEAENIIMSVGSQRIGLKDPLTLDSFKIVREVAPNIPIIGNIGIGQISALDFKIEDFVNCINMINADVMAIHFNALHELLQDKGNISYKLFRENFKIIRKNTSIPIIAKEVGSGFNQDIAFDLNELGFDGFDVGGAGGTSFAAIELYRNNDLNKPYARNPAEVFKEWGIPTPVSIVEVRKVSQKLIIATGGLKSGIDIAKAIVLGADIGGFAYKFLQTAWNDYNTSTNLNTLKEIQTLKKELRSTLWLMNLKNIKELKSNYRKRIILGKLNQWIK